jgi:hypothetical protein
MKKFLLILFIAPTVLLAARHLNTVPYREWDGGPGSGVSVCTVESWDGSIYEGHYTLGGNRKIVRRSKHFEDLLPLYARYAR